MIIEKMADKIKSKCPAGHLLTTYFFVTKTVNKNRIKANISDKTA